MQFGGWYNNPAQGGKNMRWWGGNTWTAGEDPTGGRGPNWQGTTATPTAISTTSIGPVSGSENYRDILTNMMAGREAENAKRMSEYEAAQGRISGELGIPGLTGQLTGIRGETAKVQDLLSKLEGDINVRTSGQLMNESQRRRLLASEETPLRTQLASLATGQQVAGGQLELAYTQLDRQLAPLLSKITSDQVLSSDEWKLASDLAIKEREHEQALALEKEKTKTATASGFPAMTFEQFKTAMGGGSTTGVPGITEAKPTSILGPMSAVSPGGQWYWDYSSKSWIPLVA